MVAGEKPIDPRHAGRFDKARRLEVVWQWLRRLPVDALVTHQLPFDEAPRAFLREEGAFGGVFVSPQRLDRFFS